MLTEVYGQVQCILCGANNMILDLQLCCGASSSGLKEGDRGRTLRDGRFSLNLFPCVCRRWCSFAPGTKWKGTAPSSGSEEAIPFAVRSMQQ